jgi:hypothetical protein
MRFENLHYASPGPGQIETAMGLCRLCFDVVGDGGHHHATALGISENDSSGDDAVPHERNSLPLGNESLPNNTEQSLLASGEECADTDIPSRAAD